MKSRVKLTDEFDDESALNDSKPPEFSELDLEIPKRSPMRRKDRQREGGIQKKRKGNEKRKNSRLKYEYE